MIADTAIGRIQTLTWDITICIRCIVGGKPIKGSGTSQMVEREASARVRRQTYQAWTNICFARSDALVVVAVRTLEAICSRL